MSAGWQSHSAACVVRVSPREGRPELTVPEILLWVRSDAAAQGTFSRSERIATAAVGSALATGGAVARMDTVEYGTA